MRRSRLRSPMTIAGVSARMRPTRALSRFRPALISTISARARDVRRRTGLFFQARWTGIRTKTQSSTSLASRSCRVSASIFPDVGVTVIGRNPSDRLRVLGKDRGIEITGTVDDVRPFIEAGEATRCRCGSAAAHA